MPDPDDPGGDEDERTEDGDPAESLREAIEALGATGRLLEPSRSSKAIEQFGKELSRQWELSGAAEALASFGAATANLDRLAELSRQLKLAYPAAPAVDWPGVANRLGPEADVPLIDADVDALVLPAQEASLDALVGLARQHNQALTDLVKGSRRDLQVAVAALIVAVAALVLSVL